MTYQQYVKKYIQDHYFFNGKYIIINKIRGFRKNYYEYKNELYNSLFFYNQYLSTQKISYREYMKQMNYKKDKEYYFYMLNNKDNMKKYLENVNFENNKKEHLRLKYLIKHDKRISDYNPWINHKITYGVKKSGRAEYYEGKKKLK